MEIDSPQQDFGDFPITLPAAHQSLTLEDLQSFTNTNTYNQSNPGSHCADLAHRAPSVRSTGMTSSFPYFAGNDDTLVDLASPSAYDTKHSSLHFASADKRHSSSYNLPLSPAHSLVSHSRDSDLYLDGTHGPTTPEEWSTMVPPREKGHAGAWNGGVPPYYDTYASHDSSSMHVDQFAHLGAGFDSHAPSSMGLHQQHHDDLVLGPSRASPYPPASSFMPMSHMPLSPASSSPFLHADSHHSSIPRGFVHQPSDAFSGLLMPGSELEHRHSSPSSFTTQDDRLSSSVSSAPKRRANRGSRSSAQPQRRASRAGSASALSKKQELRPYPTPVGSAVGMSPGSSQTPECTQCSLTFRDVAALQKHIKSEHTRPLVCVFHYAGCTSRFASKNEWKRHVASQHLALRYWLCTEGTCGQTRGPSTRSRAATLPSFGSIFNRKDLYTQHIRRMHLPTEGGSPGSSKKPLPSDYEDRLRELQARAARIRCALPSFMLCPAVNCGTEFHGPNAWDDRMEHVAGHLERAAAGEEPPVTFGGQHDWTLTEWAASDGVQVTRRGHTGDTWTLCNPLRGEGASAGRSSRSSIDSASKARGGTGQAPRPDEDAEGEDWRH